MKTVSTLCATGVGIALAPAGLAIIREENRLDQPPPPHPPSTPHAAMTAVASSPFHHSQLSHNHSLSFSISPPPTARSLSEGYNGKVRSGQASVGQKRMLTPAANVTADRAAEHEEGHDTRAVTPTSQSASSWLRRLSSSMSTSRDMTQTTPGSRPTSAVFSHTNGSLALSQSTTTTPVSPIETPPTLPPNRLVKRSTSLRSFNGSSRPPSSSRLPLPTLRRPATSHQRSADLQHSHLGSDQSDHTIVHSFTLEARDPLPRHYFTPRRAAIGAPSNRRRSSSGIPTPIKRVYPDRKYKPVLVPATAMIQRAPVELDLSADEEAAASKVASASSLTASSPIPASLPLAEGAGQPPRRSFSIGDLMSTGPQPLWRRPSQKKLKHSASKLVRRRDRIVSAPQESMGNTFSIGSNTDSERPAKRRDITNTRLIPRSIYSSSSSNPAIEGDSPHEVNRSLANDTPTSGYFERSHSPYADAVLSQPTPPLEHSRLPSTTSVSATARAARVSAALSEAPSLVDSDSEYRSIGDASTDYQSDTNYSSYNTRTTRSSSGRRGPHIEKIFEDSPPTYSSGRSIKLKDFLNDASFAGGELGGQYRHSIIEEEEGSMTNTPVRSLQANSVLSTPSARAVPANAFTSSPPEMRIMPDPDEMDWDASDDEADIDGQMSSQFLPSARKALTFRFGPTLRASDPFAATSTSDRMDGPTSEKTNLYDWSETQPSPSNNDTPARPRTAHGKKDAESRGGRANARRVPNGMHARSHSVPVAPEVGPRRTNVVANRFGTWNVGSRAVTEDWNEDFAFDEMAEEDGFEEHELKEDGGERSRVNMVVPRSIREQQENVVANISLLKEWGLLIEELKELRIRAVALDMLKGPYARAWEEVDAMIELADQETEEHTLQPRRSPPSSPGFDYGAFEDQTIAAPTRGRAPRVSDSVLEVEKSLSPPSVEPHVRTGASQTNDLLTRPRQDSEAVARSVIEALQSKKSKTGPSTTNDATTALAQQSRKVPFDTSTLRHIVPYVKGLKRRVKEALRETEGLRTSPRRSGPTNSRSTLDDFEDFDDEFGDEKNDDDDDLPPFQSPFTAGANAIMLDRKSRREQADTDNDGWESPSFDQGWDLAQRVQKMNLPR